MELLPVGRWLLRCVAIDKAQNRNLVGSCILFLGFDYSDLNNRERSICWKNRTEEKFKTF